LTKNFKEIKLDSKHCCNHGDCDCCAKSSHDTGGIDESIGQIICSWSLLERSCCCWVIIHFETCIPRNSLTNFKCGCKSSCVVSIWSLTNAVVALPAISACEAACLVNKWVCKYCTEWCTKCLSSSSTSWKWY
jgi:hypothetical protein